MYAFVDEEFQEVTLPLCWELRAATVWQEISHSSERPSHQPEAVILSVMGLRRDGGVLCCWHYTGGLWSSFHSASAQQKGTWDWSS